MEDLSFHSLLQGLKDALGMSSPLYSVHRLDKYTTGSLILARTDRMARDLSSQFQNRTVEKTYLALARGGRQTFPARSGQIRNYIKYDDGNALIVPERAGKPAATDWELVASSTRAPISLLRLRLLTGLKHQLRVHLAEVLKAPILGDTAHSKTEAMIDIPQNRLFLHSSRLSFFRYRSQGPNKRYRFGLTAPVPSDFRELCQALKIYPEDKEVDGGVYGDDKEITEEELADLQGQWWATP